MKLQIKKFKALENLSFSIPAQITGGNGLGKSTILEAISFVLTGKDLSGNEFKQVYDNRSDLHDAIADASYFDNYGNEWNRVVKPVFKTNRAGVEYLDIKCSTTCSKNSIPCNDFSDEFQDFFKFGTDYFFTPKKDLEVLQRSIFIDLLKSKLPEFDVNSASLKLKELKRSQKIEVDLVKNLQDANKNTKDVPVPVFPSEIEKLNGEYIFKSESFNPELVAEINKKNNSAMGNYYTEKGKITGVISNTEIQIVKVKSSIETEKELLEAIKKSVFVPKLTNNTFDYVGLEELKDKFESLEYFENIQLYAEKHFHKNQVLVENQIKIKDLMATAFIPIIGETASKCPLSGEFCETAKEYSEKAQTIKFDSSINTQITSLKSDNRRILEKEMNSINRQYNAAKSDLQEAERKLNRVIEDNRLIEIDNNTACKLFASKLETSVKAKVFTIENGYKALDIQTNQLRVYEDMLSKLKEPTPEKLPESVEISDELKEAHDECTRIKIAIHNAEGVNENNVKLISDRSKEITEKQANLLTIIEKITTLTTEISDYFSNLSNIVREEFAGDIEIDVQLLEYVMSKDEYKDCFKITANGKVFPYETNGALQNNVKMQILFNLQRLKGYTGVTVMDNCEANTTQPINTLGLNCVLAFATNYEQLIIK